MNLTPNSLSEKLIVTILPNRPLYLGQVPQEGYFSRFRSQRIQSPRESRSVMAPPRWKIYGNCVGEPSYLFYSSNLNLVEKAREICQGCPVQVECLQYGIVNNEFGVWGGKTESERKFLRRAAIVRGLPLIDLLRRNKHEQERPANVSPLHLSYKQGQRRHILATSEMVAALSNVPFG